MSDAIDAFDRKILYALDVNARASASEIAKNVKLSKEGVIYRINRLVERGYIKNFYAIVNVALFGYKYYKVFLAFQKLSSGDQQKIVDYLKGTENCINIRVTDGKYDIVFLAAYKRKSELKNFLQNFSSQFGQYLLKKNIHTVMAGYKLTFFEGDEEFKPFFHDEPTTYKLKEAEKKILSAISLNARIKTVDLARQAGLDVRKVQYSIKKLVEKNILVGYSAAFNLSALPKSLMLIDFRLNNTSKVPSMIEFFNKTNSGLFAYELLGDYDLSIELYLENDFSVQEMLKKFQDNYLDYYISYDIAHVYEEHNMTWLPFSLNKENHTK